MRTAGSFPTETSDCILGESQTCKFFQSRTINDKGVFIAAPVRLQKLVDVVKEVCISLKLEPTFATEKKEYNRFAFCNNVCRPMLESSFVVVIGDWDSNMGNANVAFEYGIATALGCNIVPIRVEGNKGGPFDMVALHSIVLKTGWDKPERFAAHHRRIREAFIRTKEKVALGQMADELPKLQKKNVMELIQWFDQSYDTDEMKTIVSALRRIWQTDNRVLRDPDFVKWAVSVVEKFTEKKKRIRTIQYFLDPTFFEMLEAVIQYTFNKPDSAVATDKVFARSLDKIARNDDAPMYARKSALKCLSEMAMYLRRPKLLKTLFALVMSRQLEDEKYSALGVESKLKNYLVYTASVGGSLAPLLRMLGDAKANNVDLVLQTRVKNIEEELRKP